MSKEELAKLTKEELVNKVVELEEEVARLSSASTAVEKRAQKILRLYNVIAELYLGE